MYKKLLVFFGLLIAFFLSFNNISRAYIDETGPHWQKTSVNVYVPDDNSMSSVVKNSFQTWQKALDSKLKFNYTIEKNADIVVKFSSDLQGELNPVARCNVKVNGKNIEKSEILITSKTSNSKQYSEKFYNSAILHVVGSAIGLKQNERKPASIMYLPISEQQRILKTDVMKLYKIYGWSYFDRRFPH